MMLTSGQNIYILFICAGAILKADIRIFTTVPGVFEYRRMKICLR